MAALNKVSSVPTPTRQSVLWLGMDLESNLFKQGLCSGECILLVDLCPRASSLRRRLLQRRRGAWEILKERMQIVVCIDGIWKMVDRVLDLEFDGVTGVLPWSNSFNGNDFAFGKPPSRSARLHISNGAASSSGVERQVTGVGVKVRDFFSLVYSFTSWLAFLCAKASVLLMVHFCQGASTGEAMLRRQPRYFDDVVTTCSDGCEDVTTNRNGGVFQTVTKMSGHRLSLLLVALTALLALTTAAEYNVVDYGARPDGGADSAGAFLAAWGAACNDTGRSGSRPVLRVPAGRFLLSQAYFKGPCRSAGVVVAIDKNGTVFAPPAVDSRAWIMFHHADGLAIRGGTLDGQGQEYWACKKTLNISQSKGVSVKQLTLLNSKVFHMAIFDCTGVTVQGIRIIAPANSPNTNGIHVSHSRHVRILNTTIGTGDDCVSLGPGTSNVLIRDIECGPGHGISLRNVIALVLCIHWMDDRSIGSLGWQDGEEGVRNVTVDRAVLTGTTNGLRIKTWAMPNSGSVTNVSFSRVTMNRVANPILVDQNYCPRKVDCAGNSSGVQISNISYTDIEGSSATPVAVKFNCSGTNPCSGIKLRNIRLTYKHKRPAQAKCGNAGGSASGEVRPPSCF
ncbi:polygalacturonase-like [Aegilops tauschii subsp. strangulata]|uniref:polygalacturonase-like n=1 Tax=Aegilops tauschii subsp. strangulata TaxID=200361 RepID=UPI003CC89E9D